MSALDVAVGGVAAVRLADLDQASPRLREWIRGSLGPLRTERAPDATVRFVDRLAPGRWRLLPHPLGPTVGSDVAVTAVADRIRRGGT